MSYTDFDSNEYIFFVLDKAHHNNASFGFRAAYNDREGNFHVIKTNQIDKSTGDKMIRKFTIQKGHKTLRVHRNQNDIIEFLRNHPNCKGSKNGFYRSGENGSLNQLDVWFYELNTQRDAEIAVDLRVSRLNAQNKILDLSKSDASLIEFGVALGYTGPSNIVLFKLLEHAEKDPDYILSELDSPTMKAKSLFEEGKGKNVIIRKGITYTIEDFEIGIDDESCISTIQKDKDINQLLKKKLGKEVETAEKPVIKKVKASKK